MAKKLWVTEVTFPESSRFPGLVLSDTWETLEIARKASRAFLDEFEPEPVSIDIMPIQLGETVDIVNIVAVSRLELDDTKAEAEEEMKEAARLAAKSGFTVDDMHNLAQTIKVMTEYLTHLISESNCKDAAPALLAYALLMLCTRLARNDGIPDSTLLEMLSNIFAWDFASKDPITVN